MVAKSTFYELFRHENTIHAHKDEPMHIIIQYTHQPNAQGHTHHHPAINFRLLPSHNATERKVVALDRAAPIMIYYIIHAVMLALILILTAAQSYAIYCGHGRL